MNVVESPGGEAGAFCYIGPMDETIYRTRMPGVGVGIVVYYEGNVLLGKRKGSHGEGEWALPGGKVDPNEHPRETAIRELAEETGILVTEANAIPFWSFDSYEGIDRDFVTLYFRTQWPSDQEAQIIEPHKCEAWKPFPWRDLPENTFAGLEELARIYPDLCDRPWYNGD